MRQDQQARQILVSQSFGFDLCMCKQKGKPYTFLRGGLGPPWSLRLSDLTTEGVDLLVCTMLHIVLVMWSCNFLGGKTLVSRLPHNCGFSVQRMELSMLECGYSLYYGLWFLLICCQLMCCCRRGGQVSWSIWALHVTSLHANDRSTSANSNRNWVETSNRFLVA